MTLVPDNRTPFFRVFIALCHNDSNLFRPGRTQLENTVINLHSNGTGISYDHRLTCQQVSTVVLVVVKDIINKRSDGLFVAENGLHLSEFLFALCHHFGIGVVCHIFILCINHMESIFIQFQLDNATLVINRTGSSILNSLGHVVNIDIITEDLTGTSVLHGKRSTRKSDVGSVRKTVANDSRCANLDFTCLGINFFL